MKYLGLLGLLSSVFCPMIPFPKVTVTAAGEGRVVCKVGACEISVNGPEDLFKKVQKAVSDKLARHPSTRDKYDIFSLKASVTGKELKEYIEEKYKDFLISKLVSNEEFDQLLYNFANSKDKRDTWRTFKEIFDALNEQERKYLISRFEEYEFGFADADGNKVSRDSTCKYYPNIYSPINAVVLQPDQDGPRKSLVPELTESMREYFASFVPQPNSANLILEIDKLPELNQQTYRPERVLQSSRNCVSNFFRRACRPWG